MHDISILHNIFLTFNAHLSGLFNSSLGAISDIILVLDHLGTDKSFFEVRMDNNIPVNAPAPAVDSGKSDNLFYAGYYYNVRIGIYATQQINATATLATWKPGGDSVDVPIE